MTEQNTQRRYDTLYQPRATVIPTGTTTLPTTGSRDGDRLETKAAADNTVWMQFRYDASDSYWYSINGTPLVARILAQEATSSVTYTNLATTGPSITVPLTGDWEVEHGCIITAPTTSVAEMSYAIGGTAAVDNEYAVFLPVGGTEVTTVHRVTVQLALTAGTQLVAKYRSTTGTSSTFEKRWMTLKPLRVH